MLPDHREFAFSNMQPPEIASQFIDRPRLLAAFRTASHRRIMHICAPAGYGKTILTAQWCAQLTHPVAWLTLTSDHNVRDRFLADFAQALDVAGTTPGASSSLTGEVTMTAVETRLRDVSLPRTVVIDNVAAVGAEDVRFALKMLVEGAPRGVSFVLTSRETLPWRIASEIAAHDLLIVQREDLAFTRSEQLAAIDRLHPSEANRAALTSLIETSDGWPVIVGLAEYLLTMRDEDTTRWNRDDGGPDADFSRQALDELLDRYVDEEVLSALGDTRRRETLRLSLLARVNFDLCNLLFGRSESAELLKTLINGMLLTLDDRAGADWSLSPKPLRASLQRHAHRELLRSERDAVRATAALWHIRENRLDEAIGDLAAIDETLVPDDISSWLLAETPDEQRHPQLIRILEGTHGSEVGDLDRVILFVAWIFLLRGRIDRCRMLINRFEPGWRRRGLSSLVAYASILRAGCY
ncbi:MAG TPA: AAA family ATPase, partial [Thermomicrobiales bacterium]|nr:AAA family ATPase [Thermomicrobiales bacterium]